MFFFSNLIKHIDEGCKYLKDLNFIVHTHIPTHLYI